MIQMVIKYKYEINQHIKYKTYSYFSYTFIEERGYIVGYKYTTYPFLEKPILEYGILKDSAYKDNQDSLAKKEEPFNYCLDWAREEDIIKVL